MCSYTRLMAKRVQVSERALIQRINRRLKRSGEQLRAARSEAAERDLGRHFVVDVNRNAITIQNVDLEKFGRKLGVLQPWEVMQ